MNIFYLHKDPHEAAKLQYNKHVVKMILESAQILCTAHHEVMGENADVPYKRAHVNHPSTIWARRSANNYEWLYHHFVALSAEYKRRYGKEHLSYTKCKDKLSVLPGGLSFTGLTDMPQCMPDEYKDLNVYKYVLGKAETPCPQHVQDRIWEEMEAYGERDMHNLLRYMIYLVDFMRENDIVWGVGRGSSVASYVLYIIGVHKINSIQYDLDWREFLR